MRKVLVDLTRPLILPQVNKTPTVFSLQTGTVDHKVKHMHHPLHRQTNGSGYCTANMVRTVNDPQAQKMPAESVDHPTAFNMSSLPISGKLLTTKHQRREKF